MSDKYVTLAGFGDPVKAAIARGRLESEGVTVFVSGDLSAGIFFGVNNVGGQVELRVPVEQLAKSVRILARCGDADHLSDEVREEMDEEEPVWVCPLCGEAVRAVLPLCPACHTPRGQVRTIDLEDDSEDETQERVQIQRPVSRDDRVQAAAGHNLNEGRERIMAQPPAGAEEETDTDIVVPPLTTMVGDSMARWALLAVLFSPMLAGLSVFYSIWLLVGLTFYRGELSARALREMYIAVFLNGSIVIAVFIYCSGLVVQH
jgi:hypothetical protein